MQEMCRRLGFDPWVRKIPWSRKLQPTPVFLPGKSHGQKTLARELQSQTWLSNWGSKHDYTLATTLSNLSAITTLGIHWTHLSSVLCEVTILNGSLVLLIILQTDALTAFVLHFPFKDVYIVNILGRHRNCFHQTKEATLLCSSLRSEFLSVTSPLHVQALPGCQGFTSWEVELRQPASSLIL